MATSSWLTTRIQARTTTHQPPNSRLTFQFEYRYHVFWTLPLEIAYYFLLPVFVLLTLRL
ncbi:hypothetical protein Gpo141_00002495, partial [Globisporangium polare]